MGTTRTIRVDVELDLRGTLRGTATWGPAPWLAVDDTGGWYAARTDDGPGTVHVRLHGDRLEAEAWGPGADRLLHGLDRLCGLHDDPSALVPRHPAVAEAVRRQRGVRMAALDTIVPTLVGVVLAQKVTGKESRAAMNRLTWRWGAPAPGPREGLMLVPTPRQLAGTPCAEFHPLGVERKRAMIVIEVARRARRLEACVGMPFEDAHARLQHVTGIGPWTAGVVMGEALGDPDAVPVGDYHLPNVVAYNLTGEARADDARMLELLEPYAGQRGRVVRLLKRAGAAPPKWGPRSEARDIRKF
jgi:3-methyladenine DNA glycosylase/8-oxoguanine DNA glycosylase